VKKYPPRQQTPRAALAADTKSHRGLLNNSDKKGLGLLPEGMLAALRFAFLYRTPLSRAQILLQALPPLNE
jgi:hypothetical protein